MAKKQYQELRIFGAPPFTKVLLFFFLLLFLANQAASVGQKQNSTRTQSTPTKTAQLDSTKKVSSTKSDAANKLVSRIKEWGNKVGRWANDNPGLLTLIALIVTVLGTAHRGLRKIVKSSFARLKETFVSSRSDKRKIYLEHITTKHRYLPVAGFETNLRIPIPLEKVYITLLARMAELDKAKIFSTSEERQDFESNFEREIKVQDALKFALERNYDGLIILGQPGSGKTTLTKYFLLCFAHNKAEKNLGFSYPLLPILLFLRLVDPKKTFVDNILASLQPLELGLDEAFFLSCLREGKAILLLDGLDEIPTETKRRTVSRWIHEKVHLAFPRCPVIVTSRFSGYRGKAVLPGHYLRLEIQDYRLPQIKQFIENWLTAVETHLNEDTRHWRNQAREAAGDLYNRIKKMPALLDLAVNPLMLQIIALVHRDRNTLPERRVELYKECTDVLLERWDKAKGLDVLLSAPEARQLLQPVALWMHSIENRREVSKQEALSFIEERLPRVNRKVGADQLLRSWQERSGIFKGEGDVYFFHHLSFQEYLTAEEIRNTRETNVLVKNFDKAWWREPTLLAMGLTNPPIFEDFMHALLSTVSRDGAGIDFMLRCIDEAMVKFEEPFIHALRRLRRFDARYRALLGLKRIGTEKAKEAVRTVLRDRDQKISDLARTILRQWGEEPVEERPETVHVLVKGMELELPKRIYNPVEHNSEYLLIPGGKFIYSVTKEETEVPPRYFAKYPVTNKLYRSFIDYLAQKGKQLGAAFVPRKLFANSLLEKAEKIEGFTEFLGKDTTQWAKKLRSRYDDDKRFNGDDQPVVAVSWYAAMAYCHWMTELHKALSAQRGEVDTRLFRLPAETEWEWAASGGKRPYPWGKEKPDKTRANYEEEVGQTTPVGAYPAGATPEGLMDMAGNVWEWMENPYRDVPAARALRGGSWDAYPVVLRCDARVGYIPDYRDSVNGFRLVCVRS